MIDLTELRSLVAVVDHGSIAAAARALGYSAPAVSRHVSHLERRLGLTLLRRGARSSVSTVTARRIADQARIVLEETDSLLKEVATIRDSAEGALRLAYTRAAATVLVPRAMAYLRETHPGIKVALRESDLDDDVIGALEQGEVDLGLVWGFPDRVRAGLDMLPLLSEDLVLVTSESRADLHVNPTDLAPLVSEPMTTTIGNRGTPALVDQLFLERGLEPPPRTYPCADHAQMHGIVRAGLASALLPSLGIIDVEDGVLRSSVLPDFRRIQLAWVKGEDGPPTRAALTRAIWAATRSIQSPFVTHLGRA